MSDYFVSSNRTTRTDLAVTHDIQDVDLSNQEFVRLVAIRKRFVNCDFRNSTFNACYLRKCSFDSCDFRGSHFDSSDVPSSHFDGCRFDYATFANTRIDPEILKTGCPAPENLKMRFARSLRVNFQQLGDVDAANESILLELSATEAHLRKAAFSPESYYRNHYKRMDRIRAGLKWSQFRFMDFIWGNGERPIRLLRTVALLFLAMAGYDAIAFHNPWSVADYKDGLLKAPAVLLGAATPSAYSNTYLALIAFCRLALVSLLISIFVRRFQRR